MNLYFLFRGIFDMLIFFIALDIVSPALLIIGIAIKIDSKCAVVFKQLRIGKGGKP